ncbi:GGDEF domain-containing protein [Shewanella sp. Isolate8]|uniref:GGDEF domain-containing protein n=1 Tax=Shewanella sp. Isolate8 TaxID=2908529 RepID=UPI001EFD5E18|nr:GGDEF domain-containing protein [Shewanella sp. Isolate8]MCG9748342.1 GGDEF domain-containing protein [Shewanella sp. Isolate8]
MGILEKFQQTICEHEAEVAVLFTGSKTPLYIILGLACSLLLSLAVKNFLFDHYLLASLLGLFTLLVLIDVIALHKGKTIPIHTNIVVTLLLICLGLTIHQVDISAIFWAFPIAIAILYIVPFKTAMFFFSLMLALVGVETFTQVDSSTALRTCVALSLTMFISSLIAQHMRRLQRSLKEESIRDPMTNALNRRQLSSHLSNCLARKQRHGIDSVILLLDIDHFKQINDTYGHAMGDRVLKRVTQTIFNQIRETDLLFRVGGEEFILLMHDIDLLSARRVAEKLRLSISEQAILDHYPVTVSIGISMALPHIKEDDWIRQADNALYNAKDGGRNRVSYHEVSA